MREHLAWAAGLFDGEGSIWASEHGSLTAHVTQNADNVEVLTRFIAALGFGTLLGPYERARGDTPTQRASLHRFEYVQAAMAMMWPWLGRAKKAQYVRCLEKSRVLERRRGGNQRVYRMAAEARRDGRVFVIFSPRHLLFRDRHRKIYRSMTPVIATRSYDFVR